MFRLSSLVLGAIFTLLLPQLTYSQQVWDLDANNPLVELGTQGTWDDDAMEAAYVIHDGTEYLMYYTGRKASENRTRIGLATSPDGVSWTRYGSTSLLDQVPGTWDYRDHQASSVLFDGTTYHMWYGGVEGWYTPMSIGYATSTDGRTWTKFGANPVITPGPASWDSWRVHPNTVLYLNGTFHMWYWGESSGSTLRVIGYASSADGVNWVKHPSPVLEPGVSGEWDANRVYNASVIWNGNEFEMWYTGQPSSTPAIGYATSSDGLTWQKHGQLTSLGFARDPSVMLQNGQYKIWFNGNPCCIHYATSGEPVICMGSISGVVSDGCAGQPNGLLGVVVDAYDVASGDLIASDTTSVDGRFLLGDLDTTLNYIIGMATPLGFVSAADVPVSPQCADSTSVDFTLQCIAITGEPRSPGYWKHEFAVATGGNGRAHLAAAELCAMLDDVELHFNNNPLNPVVVYEPPASGVCEDKLDSAWQLLSVKGNAGMAVKAKRQLMTVLLNVTANYISQRRIVTDDGATVSQAITYCDDLLSDSDPANDETAKDIAEAVNHGQMLAAGSIPLSSDDIAFSPVHQGVSAETSFRGVYPNPFNPRTTIEFSVSTPTRVRLAIYSVAGKLVDTLADREFTLGAHAIEWTGEDSLGRQVASGVYFARLEASGYTKTRKLILVK